MIGLPKKRILSSGQCVSYLRIIRLLTGFLGSDLSKQYAEVDEEYSKLQIQILEKDKELGDLQTQLTKIQSAPSTDVGNCLGREFYYDQPKTPDELLRDLISHVSDFHRVS